MVFQPSISRTYVGFQGGVIESCILEFNVSPFKIPRSELIYPIFCLRTVIPLWLFKKGSGPGSLGPRITETSVFDREIKCWCVEFGWKTIRRGGGQEGAYWTHLATSLPSLSKAKTNSSATFCDFSLEMRSAFTLATFRCFTSFWIYPEVGHQFFYRFSHQVTSLAFRRSTAWKSVESALE